MSKCTLSRVIILLLLAIPVSGCVEEVRAENPDHHDIYGQWKCVTDGYSGSTISFSETGECCETSRNSIISGLSFMVISDDTIEINGQVREYRIENDVLVFPDYMLTYRRVTH